MPDIGGDVMCNCIFLNRFALMRAYIDLERKRPLLLRSNGRYVYETKRQGRIAHHHTDATVPHIVALLGSTFHAAKIGRLFDTSK